MLGDFNGERKIVVALEGKGSRDPLDRPFAGRQVSAVGQGYRYAISLTCDWTELDSDAFVAEGKRIRGKKTPLSAAALKSLRDEHTRTIEPARAQAAEPCTLNAASATSSTKPAASRPTKSPLYGKPPRRGCRFNWEVRNQRGETKAQNELRAKARRPSTRTRIRIIEILRVDKNVILGDHFVKYAAQLLQFFITQRSRSNFA